MKRLILLITSFFILSCNSKNSGDSGSTVRSNSCPSGLSASSNLPISPSAQSAVPLHSNGKATSFYIQLRDTVDTSYTTDVYDVDLFDVTSAQIASLKSSGKKVVCYFSAGSSEDWRQDFNQFQSTDMGKDLDGWAGEKWLDIRSQNVLNIMEARLNLAVTKGCDGVDPDNVDGYTQDSCFDISADDQLAYNRKIANLARSKGLAVGLKNNPDQAAALASYYDFSVTEQCYQFNECNKYSVFPSANKPVFNLEYETKYRSNPDRAALCSASIASDIRTSVMALALDGSYRNSCD